MHRPQHQQRTILSLLNLSPLETRLKLKLLVHTSDAYTTRQALSFVRSTKFDHPLTAHPAPPEHKHTPHLLFHESANQLAQKAQHSLAPYCGMSFLAISALFLLYIHFGKSLWFTWIPCNEASACRVSIIKQTKTPMVAVPKPWYVTHTTTVP